MLLLAASVYGKVLLGSVGVATAQTHQCASKFHIGLYRACITACPLPKSVRLVWAQAFSLRESWEWWPATSISSQTRTSHGKRMQERTKPLLRWSCAGNHPRRTKPCFTQDTWVCFITRTRNSHQGWMDGYRRPWRQRGTWVGLLPIKSPKKPIKMFLVCPCEESTDEHRGK